MNQIEKKARLMKKPKIQIPGIVIGTVALFIAFGILKPDRFLTLSNVLLISRNSSILALASIGMTLVILTSQVDLSIGSVLSLSGVLSAVLHNAGFPLFFALLLAILAGVLVGLANGILIAKYRFDFWLVSFSMMGIVAGLALVLADGKTVAMDSTFMDFLGNGTVLGVNIFTIVTLVFFVVMSFVLKNTRFGSNVYSIGGSEQTATLSGIDTVKTRVSVYILSALFAAIAGIFLTSIAGSASPIAGAEYSFTAMAAVIIGGTSFSGGKGGLSGTLFGVLLLRILASGLNFLGLPASAQKAIIGFAIVAILVFDALKEKARNLKDQRRQYNEENNEK